MNNTNSSTSNVNKKSIVLLMSNKLTSHVNNSMTEVKENAFGRWVKSLIEEIPFSQAQVANKAGITDVQLSRIVTGVSGVKRDTAENIIGAINELAGREIANKTYGLGLAGFSPNADSNVAIIQLDTNVLIQLLDADKYSEEDKREFTRDFQTALEIAKRRIAEKKKQNE